jgi:signal peptidase I
LQKIDKKKLVVELKQWIVSILIALVFTFFVQSYAIAQVEVKQSSMETTLFDGERLLEEKITYRYTVPKRGDIVIIKGPEYHNKIGKASNWFTW